MASAVSLSSQDGMIPITRVSDLKPFAGKIVAYVTDYAPFGGGYHPGDGVLCAFIAPETRPTVSVIVDTTHEKAVTPTLAPPSKMYTLHKLLSQSFIPQNTYVILTDEVLKAHMLAMRILSPEELAELKPLVLPFKHNESLCFGGRAKCAYTQEEMFKPDNRQIIGTTIRIPGPLV
jgi:hypothetical protein